MSWEQIENSDGGRIRFLYYGHTLQTVKILTEIRYSYLRFVLNSSSGATYISVRSFQDDVFSLTVKDERGLHHDIQL